jgi:hypothetical protein
LTALPAVVFSEITGVGPTVSSSLAPTGADAVTGAGVAAGGVPTVNVPRMDVECGSQT